MKGTQNRDMAYLTVNGDLNKRVASYVYWAVRHLTS